MMKDKGGFRGGLRSRTIATLAIWAALCAASLGAAGCGTGIYQDFTNAIDGCCCDDDDCDDCDDCDDWYGDDCYSGDCYYDDCYYGDCGGGWWDFGFGLGFLDGGYWGW